MSQPHSQHPFPCPWVAALRGAYFRGVRVLLWGVLALLLSLSPVGADVRYFYDEAGRLVQVINNAGESARYRYDAAGNVISITRFTVGALAISEFTPDQGPIGTTVTISGVGFSATASANSVTFNGVSATVSTATPTTLVTTVPPGATTGPLTVAVGAQMATSTTPFTVTTAPVNGIPVITAFTPVIGTAGTAVSIAGNNFAGTPGNNVVHFNLTQATVGSSALTTINTTVPTGATSGPIKVRTPAGTALSSADFFVVPPGSTADKVSVTQRIAVDGAPLSINTGSAGKVALVLFNGTQGQYLGLGFTSVTVTGGTAMLAIKTPSGVDFISPKSFNAPFSLDLPRLPETGSYTMVIVSSASAVVSATVTLSSDLAGVLAANGVASVFTSTRAGQNARYTFTGNAGQNLSLVLTGDTFPGVTSVSVYNPNGSQLTQTSLNYSSGPGRNKTLDLSNLLITGTYTVFITPTGIAPGSITTTLWADATGAVPINGAAVAVNLPFGRNGRYTFAGTLGQSLGLGLSNLVTTPVGRSVDVTVYKPDGTILKNCGSVSGNGSSCDLPVLPVTGTYTIFVNNDEWTAALNLLLSSDVATPLTPNGAAKVFTTTRVGQNARYTFAGSAGQNLSLVLSSDTFPGVTNIGVYKPDGNQLSSTSLSYSSGPGSTSAVDLSNLPATGTYSVFISPTGVATGSITTTLWADATGAVAVNGAALIVNLPLGRNGRYTFTGTVGQYLGLGVSAFVTTPAGKNVRVFIYKPDGTLLKGCGSVSGNGNSCDVPVLPVTGTYTVLVDNFEWAAAFMLWLSADVSGTVTINGPAQVFATMRVGQNARYTFAGSVGQNLRLVLTGDTFPGITTVYVYRPNGAQLASIALSYSSGPGSSGILNLNNLSATGTYTVFVTPSGLATGSISLQLNTAP